VQVLVDERLAENADRLGGLLRQKLSGIAARSGGLVAGVRGKGLLNAIIINVSEVVSIVDVLRFLCRAYHGAHTNVIYFQIYILLVRLLLVS
jgi:acetylornithine/succinyldiaminopimelate/putrescine aminotransferase